MKKRKSIICLLLLLLLLLSIGGTLAYLTSNQSQNNTFTAGKVQISLDEAVVENSGGNLVAKGKERTSENQSYHLYPAMTVTKDPTITVADGSESAYIGAIITVKGDIHSLIGVEGSDKIDLTKLISGGLLEEVNEETDWNGLTVYQNDNFVLYQKANKAEKTWTLYLFVKASKAAGSKTVLFDTLTVPSNYDNAEMAKINGMTIVVTAYATQTNGFTDCYKAMTSAFPSVFQFT